MSGIPAYGLALLVGATYGLVATLALAGEWTGPAAIDKIVVHADQDVSVFKSSVPGGPQEDWPNPDACDFSSRVVLRPVKDIDGIVSGISSYEQAYSTLLGAKLNGQSILVFLDGCVLFGNATVPMITAVAIK
jgi:hypothetical protein